MQRPTVPSLLIAAMVLAAIAAIGLAATTSGLRRTPSAAGDHITPAALTSQAASDHVWGRLLEIVVNDANAPARLRVHRTRVGLDALRASQTVRADQPGIVAAVLTNFVRGDDRDVGHTYEAGAAARYLEMNGQYGTFVAMFRSVADSKRAYDAAVAHHESATGWALRTTSGGPRADEPDPGLGDASTYYAHGSDYGYPLLSVYLWRQDNLLLHAVDFHPYDDSDLLPAIVRQMEARAERFDATE